VNDPISAQGATSSDPTAIPVEAVLAIDPGSHKCGLAVVRRDGRVLHRGVVATETLVSEVETALTQWQPIALVVGAGTGSKPLLQRLEAAAFGLPILQMDESHTSEAARARFVAENPPHGWQRLLPRSLRTPDRPYDDYVAVILAERYWQTQKSSTEKAKDRSTD